MIHEIFAMDFAKRQLEKYGWSEGQGLGKHSSGIITALKPKVKLNTAGIGHDPAQEFTYHWWEDAFNNAASNINVEQTKDGVKVETIAEDSPEISAVKRSKIKRDKMQYGAFIKRETLTKSGSVIASEDTADPVEKAESRLPVMPATLNDEELFLACGGLTAHKAARHGHKLSGKLQRVKEQEEAMLKAMQNKQTQNQCKKKSERTSPECRAKKKRKTVLEGNEGSCLNNQNLCEVNDEETLDVQELEKSNKKKKKRSFITVEETQSSLKIITTKSKKKRKRMEHLYTDGV